MRSFFARRRREAEQRILTAMASRPTVAGVAFSWYGHPLQRRTGMRSGRFYPAMRRLEETGLVEASWEDIRPVSNRRRRVYRLNEEPF